MVYLRVQSRQLLGGTKQNAATSLKTTSPGGLVSTGVTLPASDCSHKFTTVTIILVFCACIFWSISFSMSYITRNTVLTLHLF